jgi:lipopolysaccharide biosynthesis protein
VAGRPLFLVYRASLLPDPRRTTEVWREEAQRAGIGELHLARVESFGGERTDPVALGFDAAVEFQPDWLNLGEPLRSGRAWQLARGLRLANRTYAHRVYDYGTVAARMRARERPPHPRYPTVMPSWDNTPRAKQDLTIFRDSTPDLYEAWLRGVVEDVQAREPDDRLVFLNAWNEWAEGNHLEPDQRWGRGYLEATRRALVGAPLGS